MQNTNGLAASDSSRTVEVLKAELIEELSRLFARIERGRGPRNLEEVTVTLSGAGRYKGEQSGWKLSEDVFLLKKSIIIPDILRLKDVVILDGFIGIRNEKTNEYDGLDFDKYVRNLTSGTQLPDYKADELRDAIDYIRSLKR